MYRCCSTHALHSRFTLTHATHTLRTYTLPSPLTLPCLPTYFIISHSHECTRFTPLTLYTSSFVCTLHFTHTVHSPPHPHYLVHYFAYTLHPACLFQCLYATLTNLNLIQHLSNSSHALHFLVLFTLTLPLPLLTLKILNTL